MRKKLHSDVEKLRKDMNILKSMSGSEEEQVSSDLGYERVDQDDMDQSSSTRLTGQAQILKSILVCWCCAQCSGLP
jgi:hypothetical protein